MATYVTLAKWTDQGIRNVKEAPKRVEAVESAVKAAGGRLKDLYLVMGEYDLVVITEAPNDETIARHARAPHDSRGSRARAADNVVVTRMSPGGSTVGGVLCS
jgi:uncharacterized protein with GYD domain